MKKVFSGIHSLYETTVKSFEIAGMMRAASELKRTGHDKESRMIMKRVQEIMDQR
jgi:hypothetical protein